MSIRGVRKIQFAEFRESEGRGGGVTLVKGKLFADGIRQPELPFVLFSFSYGRRYAIFVLYDEFCNLRNKANFTLSL